MSQSPPTFLVIGAMKCATSTVCAYLEDHPDVFCVPACEPNYFSHDENYSKGPEWYFQFFENSQNYRHWGEGSNYYSARSLFPQSAERIFSMNPNVKIIYMVRHPIKRIVSAWIQNRSDSGGAVPSTVDSAVIKMPDVFIGQSQYYYNIQPFIEKFPEENIFLGFMEELSRDGAEFFSQLCNFLEIVPISSKRSHVNPSAGKRVPNELLTRLNSFPTVKATKSLLPRDLKRAVRRTMESTVSPSQISLSPAVLTDVLKIIRSDSQAFLDYAGKPQDYWQLTDY